MICLMSSAAFISPDAERVIDDTVKDLVRSRRVRGAIFVNLPLIYADGSFVTVRIDQGGGGFRVSDAGFAFREADDIGMSRSFRRTANRIATPRGVEVGDAFIFRDARAQELERAICDVAEVSWRVVDALSERAFEEEDVGLSDELNSRLRAIFGEEKVETGVDLIGASTTPWTMTALVTVDGSQAVFQAVSDNANSINRASTAFRDLSTLAKPPRLIAFVRSKESLGSRISLLVPGRVVEEMQGNEFLARAAA